MSRSPSVRPVRRRAPARPPHLLLGIVVGALLCAAAVVSASPAGSEERAAEAVVDYRAPLGGPVVDHFDPPAQRWLPGNRGIDYSPEPGTAVAAAADGQVVFAGPVAGALHVTVLHADGLRTSYSFLRSVQVHRGQVVRAGDAVGTAGGPVHVGVRRPDGTYLDPEALFGGHLRVHVRLVPGVEEGAKALAAERRSLFETVLDTGISAVTHLAEGVPRWGSLATHYVAETSGLASVLRARDALGRWIDQLGHCTPAGEPAPPHEGRRIVVLVSGLGTGSTGSSAWEVDTEGLGYAATDVVRFSYAGGRSPVEKNDPLADAVGPDGRAVPLATLPVAEFDGLDSQQSIELSADRLAELLSLVAAAEPGVPVDVIAHSQGGVVARLGIEQAGARGDLPPSVQNLVTIGTPHQGAPGATGVVALREWPGGEAVLAGLRDSGWVDPLDDRLPSIPELSETSPVIAEMRATPMPDGVRFVSLGTRWDITVPATATVDPAADDQRILDTGFGFGEHGAQASAPAVTREVALAVAGAPLTCQSLGEAGRSFLAAEATRRVETYLAVEAVSAATTQGPASLVAAARDSG